MLGLSPYGRVALANVLLARGKPTEAAEVFAQGASEPAAAGHIRYLQTRARLRAASQHPDEALEDLIACGRLEQEWEIRTPAFSTLARRRRAAACIARPPRRGSCAGP